jgi:hypothetical protein
MIFDGHIHPQHSNSISDVRFNRRTQPNYLLAVRMPRIAGLGSLRNTESHSDSEDEQKPTQGNGKPTTYYTG